MIHKEAWYIELGAATSLELIRKIDNLDINDASEALEIVHGYDRGEVPAEYLPKLFKRVENFWLQTRNRFLDLVEEGRPFEETNEIANFGRAWLTVAGEVMRRAKKENLLETLMLET